LFNIIFVFNNVLSFVGFIKNVEWCNFQLMTSTSMISQSMIIFCL